MKFKMRLIQFRELSLFIMFFLLKNVYCDNEASSSGKCSRTYHCLIQRHIVIEKKRDIYEDLELCKGL